MLDLGRPVPSGYLNQPEIEVEYQFFYEAFWELSSDRQSGMSVGQIPSGSIARFASDLEMDTDAADFLRAVLRSLDNIYLSHQSGKHPDDKIVDFAHVDDHVGVSAILKRLGKKPKESG